MSLFFLQGAPGEAGLPGDRGNPVGHMQYHNPRGWFIFLFMKTPDVAAIYDSPKQTFLGRTDGGTEPSILNTAFQIIVSKTQLAQSLYFHVGFPIF